MQPLTKQQITYPTSKEIGASSAKPAQSLVPVTIKLSNSGVVLSLSGKQYNVKSASPLPATQLAKAQGFLLNIVQVQNTISQSTLIALGQSYSQTLPQALLAVINRHPEQTKKLQQLAKRHEGYPLPNAKIEAYRVKFDNTPAITLEQPSALKNGEYAACIKSQGEQLLLCLSQIQFKAQISLTDIETGVVTLQATDVSTSPNRSRPSMNVSAEYQKLFQQLEAIPTAHIADDISRPTQQNSSSLATNNHFLASALQKAGSLPKSSPRVEPVKDNLAVVLQRLLPKLAPEPLSDLSQPQLLQQLIMTMLQLDASSASLDASKTATHLGTINLLQQLILGSRATTSISLQLAAKLNALQQQLALPDALMKLIEKTACLPSFNKLLSNLNLYQNACSKQEQSTEYFFALPYCINHYQEQLEGHIQRQHSMDDPSSSTWNLRLKFNLANGAVLITAKTQNDQDMNNQPKYVALKISSNDENLIKRVDLLQAALIEKIESIGFSKVSLSTALESIPASVLPGDHYLVKVQV
ncbi:MULTISPECIES: hypothetical protein [unclassified Shewanella]|uniref:hypothetical protein n=1 Tax=unclassified Shewanella TaxID=196818 RepID=UPI001BB9A978|nr:MULTISPECIES: hypothetical protein [unclassified Shewanella]GIU09998.1 hypothetical protein TUM4444_13590 [Shewanella sp. MBTL60-112-B1]GIU40799.1 hypothetical protein TUM4445_40670 [Shewanella sp. MBTL60-112-B2]